MASHLQKSNKKGEESSSEEEEQLSGGVFLTSYKSVDVDIPDDFLSCTSLPADSRPVTANVVDFGDSALPEYKNLYAVVLDYVLSPSECQTLLQLAEASVPEEDRQPIKKKKKSKKSTSELSRTGEGEVAAVRDGKSAESTEPDAKVVSTTPWRPALVNVGGGFEALYKSYRNSDRIIWDHQDVVDRLWERCATAPGLREKLAVIESDSKVIDVRNTPPGTRWEFRRFNKRMRFLKYQGGQFFRPHCDSPYHEPDDERHLQTLFTVHLYLNDSKLEAEAGQSDTTDLLGGATSFLSSDEDRRLDVDPKAGRVLIFQHRRLYHSGDDVRAGTKYTVRTDIIYEKVEEKS